MAFAKRQFSALYSSFKTKCIEAAGLKILRYVAQAKRVYGGPGVAN